MLSRKKLALDPGLVVPALFRRSLGMNPICSEPLDPGIGANRSGTVSSCSSTIRIVEPEKSLWRTGGGFGKTGVPEGESELAIGRGGRSGLAGNLSILDEELLARDESGNHTL